MVTVCAACVCVCVHSVSEKAVEEPLTSMRELKAEKRRVEGERVPLAWAAELWE